MMNKSKGQMYPWVTHTWNTVKGKCPHDCSYCYMKRYPQPELHFDEKSLSNGLGDENIIFVGSSCDMWAESIPFEWIDKTLRHCRAFGSKFLFQSKNPLRFNGWRFPDNTMLGCTIESNRVYLDISKAPEPLSRKSMMAQFHLPKMISIEPVMDFDLIDMVRWIKEIKPEFVSIGADSGNNHLPEPSPDKVKSLIASLQEITEVKVKDNLSRLLRL